jgi:CheY-like chemotaxis protein
VTIKNALIVNDSKSARIELQRLLEKMNLNTQAVESAEEALRYLEDQHPGIIFMVVLFTRFYKRNKSVSPLPSIIFNNILSR